MKQETKQFLLTFLKNSEEDMSKFLDKRKELLTSTSHTFYMSYSDRTELQFSITDIASNKAKLTECIEEVSKL